MINQISKILLLFGILTLSATAQTKPRFVCDFERPQTERDFKEWVSSSVKWIILFAEEETFSKIQSNQDRLQFVDKFWQRRDPDPDTVENEFRLEYCGRMGETAKFQSGIPGWKTDRGHIYVLWGKPDDIQQGRADFDGMKNILFERWHYKHIDGLGDGFTVTFIDPTESKEFRFSTEDRERMLNLFVSGKNGLTITISPI